MEFEGQRRNRATRFARERQARRGAARRGVSCRVVVDPSWIKKEKNEEGVRKERHALISRVERRETTRGDYEREEIGGEEEEAEEKKAGRVQR